MREVKGFVFLAVLEKNHFLFGRAANGHQEAFCNLVMNGISPYITQEGAEQGVEAFRSERVMGQKDSLNILRIEMNIAETEEEIHILAKSCQGDMVIIALREWGIGDMDHELYGPPSEYHAILSESITTNGFKFYNPGSLKEITKKSFEKEILYRASEIVRQGQMPIHLATIKLKNI